MDASEILEWHVVHKIIEEDCIVFISISRTQLTIHDGMYVKHTAALM